VVQIVDDGSLLAVAVIGINALLPAVDRIAFATAGAGSFLSSALTANALIAIEMIGVAIFK
jgi:hypothetical protein